MALMASTFKAKGIFFRQKLKTVKWQDFKKRIV